MSRKSYSVTTQLAVAVALSLGASGIALADGSSMSRFGGESYAYFNQPIVRSAAASPNWRQGHANGLTDSELQALSSSSLAASEFQVDHPVMASAPADTTWRQSHPNGFTEVEAEQRSSSTLAARQQIPGRSADQSNVAESQDTFFARLAKSLGK
jgi:hypothetical protein